MTLTCQAHDHFRNPVPGCVECLDTIRGELEEACCLYSTHVNGLREDLRKARTTSDDTIKRLFERICRAEADLAAEKERFEEAEAWGEKTAGVLDQARANCARWCDQAAHADIAREKAEAELAAVRAVLSEFVNYADHTSGALHVDWAKLVERARALLAKTEEKA